LITGWLLKIVVVLALIGVVFVEVGSPVIAHFQVDGAAHDAADDAASTLFHGGSQDAARASADQDAAKEGATVEAFDVGADGKSVHVRLFKQARSFVLKKVSWFKKWYEVRVSASSSGPTS
jgi:hypothetical protein